MIGKWKDVGNVRDEQRQTRDVCSVVNCIYPPLPTMMDTRYVFAGEIALSQILCPQIAAVGGRNFRKLMRIVDVPGG